MRLTPIDIQRNRQTARKQVYGSRLLSTWGSFVTIIVGEDEAPFSAHAHILRRRSPFFAAALSDRWNSSSEELTPIELPEDDPKVFDTFLGWAYTSKVFSELNSGWVTTEPTPENMDRWVYLVPSCRQV
ncbi:hypothetical protein CAC42_1601 [Sphaceloma murrayae]|uniref:BTB domain-containing protein n=1 Tax=Sphaceloma murrayae TaxID=2082308 RepID=A0A2K1R367_9PEZI|nr:hypothetical protein CAC42_1601 [Sphaceloma murrayae]